MEENRRSVFFVFFELLAADFFIKQGGQCHRKSGQWQDPSKRASGSRQSTTAEYAKYSEKRFNINSLRHDRGALLA
jgi:hypothetical protein